MSTLIHLARFLGLGCAVLPFAFQAQVAVGHPADMYSLDVLVQQLMVCEACVTIAPKALGIHGAGSFCLSAELFVSRLGGIAFWRGLKGFLCLLEHTMWGQEV